MLSGNLIWNLNKKNLIKSDLNKKKISKLWVSSRKWKELNNFCCHIYSMQWAKVYLLCNIHMKITNIFTIICSKFECCNNLWIFYLLKRYSLDWFFTRFTYLQIMRKQYTILLFFPLLLLDWVPVCPSYGK
jgi:hypothetical protein